MQPNEAVQITVDGTKMLVPRGIKSFATLVAETGVNVKTSRFNVTSTATKASAINGNDSYDIVGGEVFTTTHG